MDSSDELLRSFGAKHVPDDKVSDIYRCNYDAKCSYTTTHRSCMIVHMKCHMNILRYSCNLCSQTRSSLPNLQSHYKKLHPFVHKLQYNTINYAEHATQIREMVDKTLIKTDTPDRFVTEMRIQNQKTENWCKKVNGKFICHLCIYTTGDCRTMHRHLHKFHRLVRYQCSMCDFKQYYASDVQKHCRQHKYTARAILISDIWKSDNVVKPGGNKTEAKLGKILPDTRVNLTEEVHVSVDTEIRRAKESKFASDNTDISTVDTCRITNEDDDHSNLTGTELIQETDRNIFEKRISTTIVNQSELSKDSGGVLNTLSHDHLNRDRASRQIAKLDGEAQVCELAVKNKRESGYEISLICKKPRISDAENKEFEMVNAVRLKNKKLRIHDSSCMEDELSEMHDVHVATDNGDKENKETKLKNKKQENEYIISESAYANEVIRKKSVLGYSKIGKDFHCSYCDVKVMYTNSHINIYNHLMSVHAIFRYKCKLCSYKSFFLGSIKKHFSRRHKGRNFCFKSVSPKPKNVRRIYAEKGMGTASKNIKMLNDSLPAKKKISYATRSTLTNNKLNTGNGTPMLASGIQKVRTAEIDNDSRTESNTYDCTLCDLRRDSPSSLYYHMCTKHEMPRFNCPLCDYKNYFENKVSHHISNKHPSKMIHRRQLKNMKINVLQEAIDYTSTEKMETSAKSINISVGKDSENNTNKFELLSRKVIPNGKHLGKVNADFSRALLDDGEQSHKNQVHVKHARRRKKYLFCNQCEYCSKNITTIYKHMHHKHGQSRFQCAYCDDRFFVKTHVVDHCKKSHSTLKQQYHTVDLKIQEKTIGRRAIVISNKDYSTMVDSGLDINSNVCTFEEIVQNEVNAKCYDSLEKNIRSKLSGNKGFFSFHDTERNITYYNESELLQIRKHHTPGEKVTSPKQSTLVYTNSPLLGTAKTSRHMTPQDDNANLAETTPASVYTAVKTTDDTDAHMDKKQKNAYLQTIDTCSNQSINTHGNTFDDKGVNADESKCRKVDHYDNSSKLELGVGIEKVGKPELLDDDKEISCDATELCSSKKVSTPKVFIGPRSRNRNLRLSTKATFLLGLARNESHSVGELLKQADNRMEAMVIAAKLQSELTRRLNNNSTRYRPADDILMKKLPNVGIKEDCKVKAKRKNKINKRNSRHNLNCNFSINQTKEDIRGIFNAANEEHRRKLNEIQLENNHESQGILTTLRPKLFIHLRIRRKRAEQSSKAAFLHGLILNTPSSISSLLDTVKDENDMTTAINLELELARRLRRLRKGKKGTLNGSDHTRWESVKIDGKNKLVDNGRHKSSKCRSCKGRRRGNSMEDDPRPESIAVGDDTCKGKKSKKENQRYKCGWCAFRSVHSATIVRHQLKKHPEEELDIVKLKGKFPTRTSPGLSGVTFNCESCNYSGSLRHQLHLHNDRHHQGATNRDGVTDCESDSQCNLRSSPLTTISEMNFLKEKCKQNKLEIRCVDFLHAGLDYIEQAMKTVGVSKVCVDELTEEDFVSMATEFRENVTFNDATKAGYVPVDLDKIAEEDVRKLVCS